MGGHPHRPQGARAGLQDSQTETHPTTTEGTHTMTTMTTGYSAHCRRTGCPCQHDTCFRGWRDQEDGRAMPCNLCRPTTHSRWIRAQEARHKGYPVEAVNRIMRGE